MAHEDYKEMIPARALSALDRAEDIALSEHLSSCAECRYELAEWQATSATLALLAEPAEPSPQLRGRILSEIRNEVRQSQSDQSRPPLANANVLPFTPAPRNAWRSVGTMAAIAAAVLFVALIVSVVALWQQNRTAQIEIAKLTNEIRSSSEKLARAQALSQVLTSSGAKMTSLVATKDAPGEKAMLAYDRAGHAMLMTNGLPAAPSGKAYQLWFIVGNKPMPGKVFTTDESGNGTLDDQLPAVALNGAVFAITMEPAPGVQSPTGPIVLSGS